MKFDLMYYLRMRYNELLTLDLAELGWYYKQLAKVKEQEVEIEKAKFDAQLALFGHKKVQRDLGG
jgi:hypothetical protein